MLLVKVMEDSLKFVSKFFTCQNFRISSKRLDTEAFQMVEQSELFVGKIC